MVSRARPQVFLDSNVIFSGLYSAQGAPGRILEHFIKGNIGVVVSPQVLEEVIRTVKEKLPDALPALRRFLLNIPPEVRADPPLAEIEHWAGKLPPADVAILAAAVATQPDYFVTGDSHFLENTDIAAKTGLRIVTPSQFLKLLEQDGEVSHDGK